MGFAGPANRTGPQGEQGPDGLSAYEVAVAEGFRGTETEWLQSLVGPRGRPGLKGEKGDKGDNGVTKVIHVRDGSFGTGGDAGSSLVNYMRVPLYLRILADSRFRIDASAGVQVFTTGLGTAQGLRTLGYLRAAAGGGLRIESGSLATAVGA